MIFDQIIIVLIGKRQASSSLKSLTKFCLQSVLGRLHYDGIVSKRGPLFKGYIQWQSTFSCQFLSIHQKLTGVTIIQQMWLLSAIQEVKFFAGLEGYKQLHNISASAVFPTKPLIAS